MHWRSAAAVALTVFNLSMGAFASTILMGGGLIVLAAGLLLVCSNVSPEAIDDERAVVTNIAGSIVDTDGVRHSYPGGHYVAVVGYRDGGAQVKIADPAKPDNAMYWVDVDQVADWVATRGYSH